MAGHAWTRLLKRQARTSKMELLVDEVHLLQAKPHYAHVRYLDGRETTAATKHLAPKGQAEVTQSLLQPEPVPGTVQNTPLDETNTESRMSPTPDGEPVPEPVQVQDVEVKERVPVLRSERVCRLVVRLDL